MLLNRQSAGLKYLLRHCLVNPRLMYLISLTFRWVTLLKLKNSRKTGEHCSPLQVKKELHPDFSIADATQENLIHCVLHARRILTLHEGLRWFDIKRYGIVVYRRFISNSGTVSVTDELKADDPRRAIQIPSDVISAGMKPNPRN